MSPDLDTDVTSIARRQFATTRRGFDQDEVRAYLRELGDLVAQLRRREAEQRARAETAEARTPRLEDIEEERLVELLGEETARILAAGRVASSDIRRKAEESAERLIAEANEQAHRLRADNEAEMVRRRAELNVELDALRAEAAADLDRRRADGVELVDEIRRAAQAEADELVDEAQVVRRRLLGDLARRRRAAREQLERLNAARERLLVAYDVVRRTVDEATSELTVALPEARLAGDTASRRVHDEPEPTVDDLEGMVTMARMAGLIEPSTLDPEPTPDPEPLTGPAPAPETPRDPEPEPEPVAAEEPEAEPEDVAIEEPEDVVAEASEPEPEPVAAEEPEPEPEPVVDEEEVVDEEVVDGEPEDVDEEEVEAYHDDYEDDWDEVEEAEAPAVAATSVDALFARIKADTEAAGTGADGEAGGVAVLADEDGYGDEHYDDWSEDEDDDEIPGDDDHDSPAAVPIESYNQGAVAHLLAPDDGGDQDGEDEHPDNYASAPVAGDDDLVARRDSALAQVEHELNRRLKRVLADEQNEVLDLLRRTKPSSSDELLAALGGHTARYIEAAGEELGRAAVWGAASVGGDPDGSYEALAVELGQAVVEPLRDRIAGSFRDVGGDIDEVTDRLRSLYREWKGQRIAVAVRHYAVAAYAQGAYGAVAEGTPLRWLVDRTSDPCPDADDNALAGAVCKGEAFPTGDHCPPAHLGCRCMVVPAE
jgi:DivIVA domain-containing protein